MKRLIFYSLFILIMTWLVYYFGQPVLKYGFYALPFWIFFVSTILFGVELSFSLKHKNYVLTSIFGGIAGIALLCFTFIPLFTTWAMFHSEKHQNLIGEVKIGKSFTEQVAPISTEKIRIVDEAMAYRLGDKVLGAQPSLGSQVDLGKFNIQKVGDKLYWVAPLLHSGYFKWKKNKSGTPGYVLVSATNERDVKLIQNTNGKEVRIKYQPNAYFSDNLQRHIYKNGYMKQGFTDFTFEINDQGSPYWVVTLYKKEIGFGGRNASGVITVDAASGEIKEYSIDKAPAWIDRIQPEDFIVSQLNSWGEYVKGFWNFSNEQKLTTTKGISLVYGENNRSYWYTGLTSVGADEGTVGFVLVDTRTKETVWYKQVGATEKAARQSAMGKVQEKGYIASFPITYNINGIPTYVMSLKDQAGLVKMIAMVGIEDYTIVGAGTTMKETLRAYKNAYNSKGNAIAPDSMMETFSIETTVERISQDIRNGNTFYYLLLKDYEDKIFIGSSQISGELPITRAKDKVKVIYDDGSNEQVDIISFDNVDIQLRKSDAQKRVEKHFQAKK
ncbi:MAG: hypothetical protein ACEPOZ_21675 [Marinifilaceae bacterium]